MFYDRIPTEWIMLFLLYGGAALASLIACIYLCLRKGNAFALDITPPVALRRWAAAFFGVAFVSHIAWALFVIYSNDYHSVGCAVVGVIDTLAVLTTIVGTLVSMLQDRKRPIWPISTATIPYATFLVLNVVYPDGYFLEIAIAYMLLFYMFYSVYMMFAVRQYGRWLRDNYADLEHKEVWMSYVLVIFILVFVISYGVDIGNLFIGYLVQLMELVLFTLLLWRVETLPQLKLAENAPVEEASDSPVPEVPAVADLPLAAEGTQEPDLPEEEQQPLANSTKIEQLLNERCVGMQLYLQHDLTLMELARKTGTNRFYLSQYFSHQGITYNAYINDLRIEHFMKLYHEAAAAGKPIVAQQLASDSGYRSYSTFSLAFKQRTGQSVKTWMRETSQ
jgi:AraC-like DNA-binding protein